MEIMFCFANPKKPLLAFLRIIGIFLRGYVDWAVLWEMREIRCVVCAWVGNRGGKFCVWERSLWPRKRAWNAKSCVKFRFCHPRCFVDWRLLYL